MGSEFVSLGNSIYNLDEQEWSNAEVGEENERERTERLKIW